MLFSSALFGLALVGSSPSAADLLIDVRDVHGHTISDDVVVTARDLSSTPFFRYAISLAGRPVVLRLPDAPDSIAIVTVAPGAYDPCTVAVKLEPGRTATLTATVTIQSSRAYADLPRLEDINTAARWRDLSRILIDSGMSETKWRQISAKHRAGLLNIYSKLSRETVAARPLAAFVRHIMVIKPERIFAEVDPGLLELVRSTRDRYRVVSSALHGVDGWKMVRHGSFKTNDEQGNLQVTFAYDAEGRLVADIDIDNHSGIRHAWDVLKHIVTRTETDPFDIHEILITTQNLDPGYELLPRRAR